MRKLYWLAVAPYLASLLGWALLGALGTSVVFLVAGFDHDHGWKAYMIVVSLAHGVITGAIIALALTAIKKTAKSAFYFLHLSTLDGPGATAAAPDVSGGGAVVFLWLYQHATRDVQEIYLRLATDDPTVDAFQTLAAARMLHPEKGKGARVSLENLEYSVTALGRKRLLGGWNRNMVLGASLMALVAAASLPAVISYSQDHRSVEGTVVETINDSSESAVQTDAGLVIVTEVEAEPGENVTVYKNGDHYLSSAPDTTSQALDSVMVMLGIIVGEALLAMILFLLGTAILALGKAAFGLFTRVARV